LASTPAQDQPRSRYYSPGPHDRINQRGDRTMRGASDEPASHSLPQPLDEDGGGGGDENASELKRDVQLAFEEQEKSSATASNSQHPRGHSIKPSHPQINHEHHQSVTGYGRLEELRRRSDKGRGR
jgi:hypothetical protein